MHKFILLIFGIIAISAEINAANILFLSLTPSPSHHIWDKTLANGLLAKGHKITFVTHSPEKSLKNFTSIIFEGVYDKIHTEFNYEEFGSYTKLQSITKFFEWIYLLTNWDMETKGFKQLMDIVKNKIEFDVIIMDTASGDYIYTIIEKLGFPPLVGTSPFGIQGYHTFSMGMDIHYAYNPVFILPYTDKMSFLQRVENYIYTNICVLYRQYIYLPNIWKISQNYFGNDIISYQEIEKHFSILLANYDPVLDYPLSLPPAIIPVGGLHTKREKSLPKDLQKMLDESKDGAILFSLGTNVLSKDLKEDQIKALQEGLGRLKQTVLWKYEEEITGLPKNIFTKLWLPQNDILAHPHLKAFITHGGALSTQEAMFHGVPVISMLFFADQYVNTNKMVNRNLGLSLKYGELTSDIVYKTVYEVINNKVYKINAEKISKYYRDQKEDPLTRAVWWVEYVIRNKGAQHLAVASRDIPFYQLNMLDFWAVAFAIIFGIFFILNKICCRLCKLKTCQRKSENKKKTN